MQPSFLLVALLCLLSPTAAMPQAEDTAAARIAQAFLDELHAERWAGAAALMTLKEFEPYFRNQLRWLRRPPRRPVQTAEDILRRDTTMPRAVAEYLAERVNTRPRDTLAFLSQMFAGVGSVDELALLQPDEALARWLEARAWSSRYRQQLRDSGCDSATIAELRSLVAPRQQVIGAVRAGPRAYAVYVADSMAKASASSWPIQARLLELVADSVTWRIRWTEFMDSDGGVGIGGLGVDCRAAAGPARRRPPSA